MSVFVNKSSATVCITPGFLIKEENRNGTQTN